MEIIMSITGCSEAEARESFNRTHDVVQSVDELTPGYKAPPQPQLLEKTEIETAREITEQMQKQIDQALENRKLSALVQPESSEQVVMPTLPEEKAQ